jgi:hypothetical protein
MSFKGSSSRRRAPRRSYHAAARSSVPSIARATPPTYLLSDPQCRFAGRQQEITAEPSSLCGAGYGEASEAKDRHFTPRKSSRYDGRRLGKDSCTRGYQRTIDGVRRDGIEGPGPATLVTPPRVRRNVLGMMAGQRLLAPFQRPAHTRFRRLLTAASNAAVGLGECSRRSRTPQQAARYASQNW